MLRVACVTGYFPTSRQPWAGQSAYQTLRFLARRCELKVFYPEASYPRLLTPRSKTPGKLDPGYQPAEIAAQYIPYSTLPVLSRPLNGWRAGRALLPHVKGFQPDIVLAYVAYPDGFAALEIGQKLKVPVIVTAIGSDLNRPSDPLCRALTRHALGKADLVCTVSHHLLKTAHNMGATALRSQAILNGCDTSLFCPRDIRQSRQSLNVPLDGAMLVYVGRLDLRKGLCELVEAVVQLRRKRTDIRCYIVGDGPDRPSLVEAIKQQRAQDYLVLVPSCPTHQVAVWMGAADLITLPSYAEGCPNVVLEALASGRPVVASEVGGIPEIMDEHVGRLVPPKDAVALSGALDDVLAREWDPIEISARHERSWSDVADDFQRSMEDVCRRKSIGLSVEIQARR